MLSKMNNAGGITTPDFNYKNYSNKNSMLLEQKTNMKTNGAKWKTQT
jgi:hypothetical protein